MRVLVVIGGDPRDFLAYGREDGSLPRLSQAYPFWDGLRRRGMHVDLFTPGCVIGGKTARPSDWWASYLALPSLALKARHYDAVVAWSTFGALSGVVLGSRLSRKLVVVAFTFPRRGLRRLIYDFALRRCGRMLFMTEQQAEVARRSAPEPQRVGYLPIGVDTQFFRPWANGDSEGVRPELVRFAHDRCVVAAGDQLRQEESILSVLDGLDTSLIRLTKNRSIEKLWRSALRSRRETLRVMCTAGIGACEVRYAYQHGRCLLNVVNSSWQPAGWTVMTEAMACALPVVVNSGLTTKEMRRYSTGRPPFIEIGGMTSGEVRQALSGLLWGDEYEARSLGRTGRDFVETHFPIERTARAVYEHLCTVMD